MALLRSVRDDDYRPEYGTLVLRDGAGPQVVAIPAGYDPTDRAPAGTVAIGGFGWLHLRTSAEPQRVLIEVHDSQPDLAGDGWDDIQDLTETQHSSVEAADKSQRVRPAAGRRDLPRGLVATSGQHSAEPAGGAPARTAGRRPRHDPVRRGMRSAGCRSTA